MGTKNGLDRSPVHLLHRAGQAVTDLFAREINTDLTPRQFAVLTVVDNNQGANQTEICNLSGVDRSTLAEMMRRLVRKGLIHRRRSKHDTRAYVLRLTDKGAHVLKSAEPLAKRVDEAVLRALGNRGSPFLDSLATLVRNLEVGTKP